MSHVEITAPDGAVHIRPVGFDKAVQMAVYSQLPSAKWEATRWVMPDSAGAVLRLIAFMNMGCVDARLDERANALVARISSMQRPTENDAELPFTSLTVPWPHQRMAYHFLMWARNHLGCGLLDMGMRTGKTRCILDYFSGLDPSLRAGLVLCPKVVVPVWGEQARRHCGPGRHLRVVPLSGGTVAERVALACHHLTSDKPTIVVMGWSVLERTSLPQKKALRAALTGLTIVADEVHFAKAPGSSRSQALAYISRTAAMRIGASGTPLAHSPLDAYGVFRYLDVGLWGTSFARFRDQYALMGGFGGHQVLSYKNLDDLAARMRVYTFKTSRDVLNLLPPEDIDVEVQMPPAAMKIYADMRDECVAELQSGTLTVGNSLAKLMRLAQISSGFLPHALLQDGKKEIIHTAKQEALIDLLESCDDQEPWVVFGRFHHDIDVAKHSASKTGRPFFELSGRHHQLDEWKAACRSGKGAVLGAQTQAGGIGVDMTDARYCAYLSKGYSLVDYEQSRTRIHGPDQTRSVSYYHIDVKASVDKIIRRALNKRADVLAFVAAELVKE